MSYEKGDKFVLEIAEVMEGKKGNLYRAKNFASLVFDQNGIQKLRRIRETPEEAYRRGYELGCEDMRKGNEDQFALWRAEGSEEAWKFVLATDEWDEDIRCYDTYAEAKADFEKWKSEQNWEPQVGDVVIDSNNDRMLYLGGDQYWSPKLESVFDASEVAGIGNADEHIDLTPLIKIVEG